MKEALARLLGHWFTEATHPDVPGVVVHGTADVEWLEGEQFLIHRSRNDHPDFPDAISIIGVIDGELAMHYFDSRGVFRVYQVSVDEKAWTWWRNVPGFSQRFTGTFDGDRILGVSQLCRDDVHWKDDLKTTYVKLPVKGSDKAPH